MKNQKLFSAFFLLILLCFSSCYQDDIDDLKDGQKELNERMAALEDWSKTVNNNISALQSIITAIQENDFITSITPVKEGNVEIGYTITFTKSSPITIYHGKNGTDGQNGKDGTDGKDGKDGTDGTTPIIGIQKDTDGTYYWTQQIGTSDPEFILDAAGNKIAAVGTPGKSAYELALEQGYTGTLDEWLASLNGADGKSAYELAVEKGYSGSESQWLTSLKGEKGDRGISPQIRINNNSKEWEISVDNGGTWQSTKVNAVGPKGDTGDTLFDKVNTSNANYVEFTLTGGEKFSVPRYKPMNITFTQPTAFKAKEVKVIDVAITGSPAIVRAIDMPQDWKISINVTENKISITAPTVFNEANLAKEALILLSDGAEKTTVRPLYLTAARGSIFYENEQPLGIIYKEKTSNTPGRIIYIQELRNVQWSTENVYLKTINQNGMANMEKVSEYILSKNDPTYWDKYPIFKKLKELNNQRSVPVWYLPSSDELEEFLKIWYPDKKTIDDPINKAGGTPVSTAIYYMSSTESSDMGFKGVLVDNGNYTTYYGREKLSITYPARFFRNF